MCFKQIYFLLDVDSLNLFFSNHMLAQNVQRQHMTIHMSDYKRHLKRINNMACQAVLHGPHGLNNQAMVIRGPVQLGQDGQVHILGEIAVANRGAEREANARFLHHRVRLQGIPLGPIVQEEEQVQEEWFDPEQFLFDEEVIPILEEEVVQEQAVPGPNPEPEPEEVAQEEPIPEDRIPADFSFFDDAFPSDLFDDE